MIARDAVVLAALTLGSFAQCACGESGRATPGTQGARTSTPTVTRTSVRRGARRQIGRSLHDRQWRRHGSAHHALRRDHRVHPRPRSRPDSRATSSSASTRSRTTSRRSRRTSAPSSAATATASRKGRFTLDGKTYKLATNNGPNHLHGGVQGFDKVVWNAEPFERDGAVGVTYTRTSPDGEEGYPGHAAREGHLHADRRQRAERRLPRDDRQGDAGQPDATQLLQPRRRGRGDILGHVLTIDADRYHAGRRHADPDRRARAGRRHAVRFPHADGDRRAHRRRRRAAEERQRLRSQLGAQPDRRRACVHAARARRADERPHARRRDHRAGLQFYTGNFLDGTITGKAGHVYAQRSRPVPRDAALPRLAESSGVSVDDPAAGTRRTARRRFLRSASRSRWTLHDVHQAA